MSKWFKISSLVSWQFLLKTLGNISKFPVAIHLFYIVNFLWKKQYLFCQQKTIYFWFGPACFCSRGLVHGIYWEDMLTSNTNSPYINIYSTKSFRFSWEQKVNNSSPNSYERDNTLLLDNHHISVYWIKVECPALTPTQSFANSWHLSGLIMT